MGRVYRAHDTQLDREIALKVLDPLVAADPERVHRFLQEARAASGLNHPNIIAIYEAGEANGVRFIASELVDGRTLREILAGGPLPLAQALDIASQVASALAAAHAAGIVHRDVKPENIMVRPDGYAKVLDFGLAKLTDSSASGAHPAPDAAATMLQTTAGVIMGTVAYMSPEQARALKVDARTDCYSLGAVIFEMITGRQPFTGATGTDVMVAILERDAPLEVLRREGLPAQLVWVIAKSLDKNPDLRHQNAADLRVDLDRIRRDIATGAVYADQEFSADRPSAILREVMDSDPDAVAMFRPSRGTMAAAAIALAAIVALPFIYARSIRADQRAGLPEAAAEIRARDFAAALGRSVEGREASSSLEESELNLAAVRNISPDEARRAVREGHAAEWVLNFSGKATDQTPGSATVKLTPDGRLRSFTSAAPLKRPALTMTGEQAMAKASAAVKQHLGIDVAGYTVGHVWRAGDGLSYDIEWKNPSKVLAHDETVRANLDDTSFSALSRTLAYAAPDTTPSWQRSLNQARGAVMIVAFAGAYVFGILVLSRTKRWSLVGRPVPLGMSGCIALAFMGLAGDDQGDAVSILAILAVGVLVACGALPGFAGIYAWLKQGSPLRLHGAEQLAAGHLRSSAVATSLVTAIAAGAVLAAIMFIEPAIGLRFADFSPDIGHALLLAGSNLYVPPAVWPAAGLGFALGIAMLYELPYRLTKRAWPVVALLTVFAGVMLAGGKPYLLQVTTTTLCVAVLMTAYALRGFAAVLCGVVITALLTDLITARAVGGPVAGSRATFLTFAFLAIAAFTVWSAWQARGAASAERRSSASRMSSKLGL